MNLVEFLSKNKIVTNEDGYENIENVLGKKVWICDYRLNEDIYKKMSRNIKPIEVEVCNSDDIKKSIYYSPIYFKHKSKVIAPYDNTGYRSYAGVSLNIFEDKKECEEFFNTQLKIAEEQFINKFERVKRIHEQKLEEIKDLMIK